MALLVVVVTQLSNFWSFVGCRIGVVVVRGDGEDREAIVGYAGLEIGAEEDVRRLEIAMNKPPCLVNVGKSLSYVLGYFQA